MASPSESIDGRYAVQAELGAGSMGRVVVVHDESAGGVPFAAKLLERPELHHHFVSEYRLLRRLSDPAFVAAHRLGVDLDSRQPFALLELCEGETFDVVRDWDEAEVRDVAVSLLRALDQLHRLDYVHGDLAPVNLLRLSVGRRVKILDLGAGGRRGSRKGSTSGVLTFAAPERLEGEPLAPAADLWSLGCLLFVLAHGRHPFPGYPARAADTPERQGLEPVAFDPLLDRLLAARPQDRHPTAAAALAHLESLCDAVYPLTPVGVLARRVREAPFHDAGEVLERLETRLRSAVDSNRAVALDISGPPGSGRSRLLSELADRLAARGIASIMERHLPQDGPGACLQRAARRLGVEGAPEDNPALLAQVVGQAMARREDALALLIDDVGNADGATRDALTTLALNIQTRPERFGQLILLTVNAGSSDVTLEPWDSAATEGLLATLFPGRRIGTRVSGPVTKAATGNPGLTVHIIQRLLEAGELISDTAAVHLGSPDAAEACAPATLDDAARAALDGLGEALRTETAYLAYSPTPLPAQLVGDDVGRALIGADLATWIPHDGESRLVLLSSAIARAARAALEPVEAHGELARRWRAAAGRGEGARAAALWHELAAAPTESVCATADAALPGLEPRHAAPIVRALVESDQWPATVVSALTGGRILEATGDVEEALRLFRRAHALADGPDDAGRALVRVGCAEARQSRHALAMEAFQQALGGSELPDDERIELLAGLSRSAVMSGALDDAQHWVDSGLALSHGDDTHPLKGRLLYTRGLLGWYRGALAQAEADFEAALQALERAGDWVEAAAAVTGLGLVAHGRGDLSAAVQRYQQALARGEQIGDQARVLTALQNLGVVYHARGDWTLALDTYQEALALADTLGQTGRVVQISGNLGNLWRYLGELGEAGTVLARGLELARQQGDRHMEAIVLKLMGDVASDSQRWAQAERLFGDAVAIAEQAQFKTEATEARLNLAALCMERQSFDEARDAASRGLRDADDLANHDLVARAHALLAGVARRSVRCDLDQAQRSIDAAQAVLDRVTNPDVRWPILLEAALLARDRDELQQARKLANDVRVILARQIDAVPGRHRDAFKALRERRRGWNETAALVSAGDSAVAEVRAGTGDDRWTRLLEINKRLSTEHDVVRLLEYIMDSAILLTGAERGFLLLSSREGDTLDVHVARNLDQENIRKKHLKISRGIARRVIDSGEVVITIDAMEDDRYRDQLSVNDLRLRSILCLPMRIRGRVLGAIYLDNRFRTSAFADDDVHFMEAFADLAAIALDNAQLIAAKEKSQSALEAARSEVESLNKQLSEQLAERTQELEATHRVVIRQQRELAQRNHYENIIGESVSIRRVFAMMDRLLDNDVPVLIEGESGTGKELVAKAIHFNGKRRRAPFVAVNCGAIPATLLESELFGHVRGAFTGASHDKKGLFEAAHRGTLLLDELGELPLAMQVKLLRVLQSGEVKKVGSTRDIRVDVRIVAATNRRLEEEVAAGRFREDLYYRLSVVPIQLPTLRERREDIPLLVQHFIEKNQKSGLGAVTGISKAALSLLQRYSWPGNVRQLEMVLKNASVFADKPVLEPHDFDSFPDITGSGHRPVESAALRGKSLSEIEREAIIVALRDNRGNKKRSAEQLGIDRRTLYNKLAAYKIVVDKELKVS